MEENREVKYECGRNGSSALRLKIASEHARITKAGQATKNKRIHIAKSICKKPGLKRIHLYVIHESP